MNKTTQTKISKSPKGTKTTGKRPSRGLSKTVPGELIPIDLNAILGPGWKPTPEDTRRGYCEMLRLILARLRYQAWGMAKTAKGEETRQFLAFVGDLSDALHNVGETMLPDFPWMTDEAFRKQWLRPLAEKWGTSYELELDMWTRTYSAPVRAAMAAHNREARSGEKEAA